MCWSAWVSKGILVAAIQLSIMLGAALGGLLLDRVRRGTRTRWDRRSSTRPAGCGWTPCEGEPIVEIRAGNVVCRLT